jgi:hypothetical protein
VRVWPLLLCLTLWACESDTSGGASPVDAGEDAPANAETPDGYEGGLPVGQLVAMELGTGKLTAGADGVTSDFAPVQAGRKIFATCTVDGCTLDLLGRVPAGAAGGSRWEVDLRDGDGELGAFQKGESRWQTGVDGKDYQVASFYFSDRGEYENALAGPGRIELRLAKKDDIEQEELIGFVSVQVAFEAVDGQ